MTTDVFVGSFGARWQDAPPPATRAAPAPTCPAGGRRYACRSCPSPAHRRHLRAPTHSIRLISSGYLHLPTGPDGFPIPPAADRIEDVRDRLRDPVGARDILAPDGLNPRVQD
ncbi:hypothetical protein [Streptomyces sp. HB132]|uniref:hypothetical protein n=1 Tax=Streptomyces sp. HB132 TaxID=767388 RepID=UPI00195F70A1|nr:hypothetical protein [Streptomyces sp. HB132]MBM7443239.1 hypothetical protein [Streptomyces sp. HB132]